MAPRRFTNGLGDVYYNMNLYVSSVLLLSYIFCLTGSETRAEALQQQEATVFKSNLLQYPSSASTQHRNSAENNAASSSSWELVFEDEFESDTLNASNWNIRQNQSHCCPAELQLYLANNVRVENGTLILETKRETVTGPGGVVYNYTSGWIDSKNKKYYQYGKWEIRAKLPAQNATGSWPAHWLMPQADICWPVGGEIDIMEATSNPFINAIFGSYRWGKKCGENKQILPGSIYPTLGGPAIHYSENYHTFGLEWNQTHLVFSVNGTSYHVKSSSEVPIPQNPFYFILNTAVAWYLPPGPNAKFPANHVIDFVRVYQHKQEI